MISKLILTVLFGLHAIEALAIIGQPREPMTTKRAMVNVVGCVITIAFVWAVLP